MLCRNYAPGTNTSISASSLPSSSSVSTDAISANATTSTASPTASTTSGYYSYPYAYPSSYATTTPATSNYAGYYNYYYMNPSASGTQSTTNTLPEYVASTQRNTLQTTPGFQAFQIKKKPTIGVAKYALSHVLIIKIIFCYRGTGTCTTGHTSRQHTGSSPQCHLTNFVKWPPSLKAYVERAFSICQGDADRTKVEKQLKQRITDAINKKELWIIDWSSQPLPM